MSLGRFLSYRCSGSLGIVSSVPWSGLESRIVRLSGLKKEQDAPERVKQGDQAYGQCTVTNTVNANSWYIPLSRGCNIQVAD